MADAPLLDNTQVLNVPVPLLVRVTVPVGLLAVPGEVSVMVTVQLVTLLTTIVVGWHVIVVVVVRTVTVTVAVPELALCGGVCVSP